MDNRKVFFAQNISQITPITPITYGRLYNSESINTGLIASIGWHVPTYTELQTLINYVGSFSCNKLRETGLSHWDAPNNATNASNFTAVGSGSRISSGFNFLRYSSYIASSTPVNANTNYFMVLINGNVSAYIGNSDGNAFSIRLINDSTILSNGQTGTYTGNNGIIYPTICIGTQEWLSVNLKETKYNNGSIIPFEGVNPGYFTNAEWNALTTPGVCAYNNDENNV